MAIPNNDFIQVPYNDQDLIYDVVNHRYVATVDVVMRGSYVNLINDWGSEENAQSYLDLMSNVIYDVILSKKPSEQKLLMQYYLSHSKYARNEILNLFLDTVWYNRRDGGFMMAYNTGANLNQGKMIEFGIDKALSSIAKQKITNSGFGTRYLNINLNIVNKFDTLDEVKDYLLDKDFITQDEYDEIKNINDVPKSNFYILYQNYTEQFVLEDLLTYKKIKEMSDW